MSQPNLMITEPEAALAGRNMLVDQFNVMLSSCWDLWPVGWRKSIISIVGLPIDESVLWVEIGRIDQGLIANGVVRNIQITNFIRSALT